MCLFCWLFLDVFRLLFSPCMLLLYLSCRAAASVVVVANVGAAALVVFSAVVWVLALVMIAIRCLGGVVIFFGSIAAVVLRVWRGSCC